MAKLLAAVAVTRARSRR